MKLNKTNYILDLDSLVGNKHVIKLVKGWISNKSVPTSILFQGEGGTGKSTLAEILGLAILCENPIEGGPCLECESCKRNIRALETGNSTDSLVKYNIATESNISDLIEELFILQSEGDKVYILEEIQSMDPKDQDKLLEEYKKLSENSYVFQCTTDPWKLKSTLKSRSFTLEMVKPNKTEATSLVRRVGSGDLTKVGIDTLIKKTARNPRDIINTMRGLSSAGQLNDTMVRDYFNHYDNDYFIEFLELTQAPIQEYLEYCIEITDKRRFIYDFKNFFVDAYLDLKAATGNFDKKQHDRLSTIFSKIMPDAKSTSRVFKKLTTIKPSNDIFSFLDIKFAYSKVDDRKVNNRIIESEKIVKSQENKLKQDRTEEVLTKLDFGKTNSFGGDATGL